MVLTGISVGTPRLLVREFPFEIKYPQTFISTCIGTCSIARNLSREVTVFERLLCSFSLKMETMTVLGEPCFW